MLDKTTGEIQVYQALQEIDEAIALVEDQVEALDINPTTFLPRVKIPTGGATTWEVPTLEGSKPDKELIGIPIDDHPARVMWLKTFEETGGGQLPDCYSPDGKTGFGRPLNEDEETDADPHSLDPPLLQVQPGTRTIVSKPTDEVQGTPEWLCRGCPFNRWGSGKNGGKACKQIHMVHLIPPDEMIPYTIIATPGSVNKVGSFFVRLKGKYKRNHRTVIGLTLEQATNQQNLKYAQIVPRLVGVLDQQSQALSDRLRYGWLPVLQQARPEIEAVHGPDEGAPYYGHHIVVTDDPQPESQEPLPTQDNEGAESPPPEDDQAATEELPFDPEDEVTEREHQNR